MDFSRKQRDLCPRRTRFLGVKYRARVPCLKSSPFGLKGLPFFSYKFNIKIYNLRITYDYERSAVQYHKTIPRGAKDHDYPRAIHMKNINLKLQLNIQLRETIYEQWNRETRLYDRGKLQK